MITLHFIEDTGEIFTAVTGYQHSYQISNNGHLYSLKTNKILNPTLDSSDYETVKLFKDNRGKTHRIHRLVALAFVPGFREGLHVDHIDGNKTNNKATNLRWTDHIGNNLNRDDQSQWGHNIFKTSKSGFTVTFQRQGTRYRLGTYPSLEEATKVRDEFMKNHPGV